MKSAPEHSSKPRLGKLSRRLLAIAIGGLSLLVVLYFVLTSSAFLKGFVVPRIGSALNGQLTVADVRLSRLSSLDIEKFVLRTTGEQPLAAIESVRVQFSPLDLVRGRIRFSEITLDSPSLFVEFKADRSSNLDPILEGGRDQDEP